MLALGVEPAVSAATSSFMIVFTASASTIQYAFLGRLASVPAVIFGLAGFMGGTIGQHGVAHVVKKYRKQSILVFLLAGITLLSGTAIIIVEGVSGGFRNTDFHPSALCG